MLSYYFNVDDEAFDIIPNIDTYDELKEIMGSELYKQLITLGDNKYILIFNNRNNKISLSISQYEEYIGDFIITKSGGLDDEDIFYLDEVLEVKRVYDNRIDQEYNCAVYKYYQMGEYIIDLY